MAKAAKKSAGKKKRGTYNENVVVTGSFLDIIKAAGKNAAANNEEKMKP